MTSVSRSTNPGSGIGTDFGSIPYGNTQAGSLTETRLSPQNSRLGMRIDAIYHDWKILGYWESDFLGQSAILQWRSGGQQQSICLPDAVVLGRHHQGQIRVSGGAILEHDDAES